MDKLCLLAAHALFFVGVLCAVVSRFCPRFPLRREARHAYVLGMVALGLAFVLPGGA